ncbi:hypothetical protein BDY17DRAFT_305422 [Neohortaea acidophila]|uniref:rRNA biogenesis protein RRP36 n=1 Tax=Neohortaea acidophila TaxID=245834 RepID=A0A6A6PGZ5_9PEZI|nr:uncharacterized protein BDY17DRAFT_305422 [Neohortaea acidophila]KAF2478567.1 hypothetical protein BDY17DRAFT_305422 [Neohortaea acidophila]
MRHCTPWSAKDSNAHTDNMGPARLLGKNVRPLPSSAYHEDEIVADDEDLEDFHSDEDASENDEDASDLASEAGSDGDQPKAQDAEDSGEEGVQEQLNNVSFAALLQAKEALSKKRKRNSDTTADHEAKLGALRDRLQSIKSNKAAMENRQAPEDRLSKAGKPLPRSRSQNGLAPASDEEEDDADSDSAPSEIEAAPSKSRTSKHAPAAQTSRRQVTRRRTVIDVPKRSYRDPRFDALHQGAIHPGNADKAYSFLRDYQKSEIAELKAAVKQARTEEDKEALKRKAISMENRLKAKEAKEREQEVLRRHRHEEKEKVEQGKKPYFPKKKELKEKALVEKFEGMKSKDRQRLIERRRKKEGQKEKKRMPQARRMAG